MSQRKPPKVITGLTRFLQGIYYHYYDRGMPSDTAKVRMFKETYDILQDLTKKEKEVPDHVLVTSLQHASRQLNNRGAELAKKLSIEKDTDCIRILRNAMKDIKSTKDQIDFFIQTYRGESYGETK